MGTVNELSVDTLPQLNTLHQEAEYHEENWYIVNIFRVTDSKQELKKDFKVHVVTNNKLVEVLADTGASLSHGLMESMP